MIGAHPDDEDTGLLTYIARGYGADAAYLALSRGDGGQNLVGAELGVDLGLLRSRELEAARAVDGARQFFTRAFDFGYSRSVDETAGLWLADSVLKDVVRIVRRFKPHVVVSVFSGTNRDGHGQHQLAGLLAGRAFETAGDPTRFPELQSEEGLDPWTPLKLYRSSRFDANSTTLQLATGELDPRSGRSYNQIAMESRSQHRSQDMGRLQPIGPAWARLRLDQDRTGPGNGQSGQGIFAGISRDESWLTGLADSVRNTLAASRLHEAAVPLAGALALAPTSGSDPERRRLLEQAVAVSAGLVIDGRTTIGTIVPGQQFAVTVELYNAGPYEVNPAVVAVIAPPGWQVELESGTVPRVEPGGKITAQFTVTVPHDAEPTQPYFLQRPLVGALYDWSTAEPEVRGLPFQPPPVRARVTATVLGANLTLEREITYQYNDQAFGEIRRPLRVVPEIDVKLSPDRIVWPSGAEQYKTLSVIVTLNGPTGAAGEVGLEADGWLTPPAEPFTLEQQRESQVFQFRLARADGIENAQVQVRAVVRTDDGRHFERGVMSIEYPHVRPTSRVMAAVSEVRVAPIQLPDVSRVGYVRGAADRVPEALMQIGLPVELLGAHELESADLSPFDAIIIGSRAYETDPALVRHNHRLLEYVRNGGCLMVQYQQYQFVRDQYAPYPLSISRPHDRITDETVPVTLLLPDHPALTVPNRIGSDDWEGWPQERGLYFAGTWDAAYTPLLEMSDPGEQPVRGGLLVAQYGEGTYVYTGLSFFRALPAGVPGAYKLFLNLIGLNQGAVQ